MENNNVISNLPEDTAKVLQDIAKEMEDQREEFGDALDDDHSANDWIALITRYATRNITHNHLSTAELERVKQFRRNMQIASAIAASAMRACDRRMAEELEREEAEAFV